MRRACSKSQVLWMTLAACTANSSSNSWSPWLKASALRESTLSTPRTSPRTSSGTAEFGADVGVKHDVAWVLADIAQPGGLAGAGDPAGDALAEAQLEFGRVWGEAGRGVDFQHTVVGIDEGERAAGSAHEADGFLHDELKGLLRVEGGVDDVADLVEQFEPVMGRPQAGDVIGHRHGDQGSSAVFRRYRPQT